MSCRRPRRDAGRGIPHQPCTHWHAESDADLLAERFDGDTDNLFALQDEITSRIAVALNLELTSRESRGQPIISTRGNYILGGRSAYWKPASRPRLVCRGWERPSAAVAKPMKRLSRSERRAALILEYCTPDGLRIRRTPQLLWGAADPRLVRNDLFRRSSHSRDPRGVTATRLSQRAGRGSGRAARPGGGHG
jgi:hypothetical protein